MGQFLEFSVKESVKNNMMYSQRAFVQAREDLGFLEKDYLDVLSEQATDEDDEESDDDAIGLTVGGAQDINNFRQFMENEDDDVPQIEAITYNGLLNEYYFDTKTRKSKHENGEDDHEKKDNDDNSKLFYPTYCYAKTKTVHFDGNENENK